MPAWRRACRVIDSAAGGLGGCPYAKGATGNVATEDVVYMLDGMGIATGVDMDKLVAATNEMSGVLGKPPVSRVAAALNAKKRRASTVGSAKARSAVPTISPRSNLSQMVGTLCFAHPTTLCAHAAFSPTSGSAAGSRAPWP